MSAAPLAEQSARSKDSGAKARPSLELVMKYAWSLLAFALISTGASAAPGGKLETLQRGEYVCSLPGDADGKPWLELVDKTFRIGNASTYESRDGSGTYLMTGGIVQFTRGPMKGMRFRLSGRSMLRALDEEGNAGRMRCVRKPR